MIAITAVLACLNGIFYRMGGSGHYARWIRPVAIGLLVMATLVLWGGFTWNIKTILAILASGGASAGFSTSYFKKKGKDALWWNWALVGVFLAISCLPYAWVTGFWLGFSIRLAVLTTLITIWSQSIGLDILEEWGRGFLIIATIPLLFIAFP